MIAGQQLVLVTARRSRVLADVADGEDAAGELVEIERFDGPQEPEAELGLLGDGLQADAAEVAPGREVGPGNTGGGVWSGHVRLTSGIVPESQNCTS